MGDYKMTLEPINLPYKKLPNLSDKQLSEHYEVLYKGYVNKTNNIRQKIIDNNKEGANGTYAEIRELKLEESFALNGVKLHEAYFLAMGGDGKIPENIKKAFIKDFGSVENWKSDFISTAMSSRGWAVLYWDRQEMKLCNGLADFHSHGAIWDVSPVLVLDVYEHAYFMDYCTKRKDYIDDWFKNVNWEKISRIFNDTTVKN
jgi:superoxide dismutase, Fe-Mn family